MQLIYLNTLIQTIKTRTLFSFASLFLSSVSIAVALPASVEVYPEPEFTSGLSNQVCWAQVPGADAYMVERDKEPYFYEAECSGWITEPYYTFSNLQDGRKYYYRVKARIVDEGTTQSLRFSQKTQFEQGTLIGVEVGKRNYYDYQVTLLDRVLDNPSFEDPSYNWPNIAGWPFIGTVSSSYITCRLLTYNVPPMPTQGSSLLEISSNSSTGSGLPAERYRGVRQTLDFSNYETLIFDLNLVRSNGNLIASVAIDGTTYFQATQPGQYFNQTIDVSELKGIHTLELRGGFTDPPPYSSNYMHFDNLRLSPPSPTTTGTMISPLINPAPFNRWASLKYNALTPAGTTVTVDVLPQFGDAPIPGYENLPSGSDLRSLSVYPIRLRANFASTSPAATPALYEWGVDYLDGYSITPYSKLLTSTQDATTPTLVPFTISPDPRHTNVTSIPIQFSEPIANFNINNLNLTVNNSSNILAGTEPLQTSDQQVWTLDPSTQITTNGVYTLTLSPVGITDRAGNSLILGATDTWTVDYTAPTPRIIPVDADPASSVSTSIVISFDEAVVGFHPADLITKNCRVVPETTKTEGLAFPCKLYPITHGIVEVSLPSGACADYAGNPSAPSMPYSFTYSGDITFPPVIDLKFGKADITLFGAEAGDWLSRASIATGDVNGDGYTDVVTAASDASGPGNSRALCGEAYVFYGRPGLQAVRDVAGLLGSPPDVIMYGKYKGDDLGSVGGPIVGDITGDGIDDILIGAFQHDGPNGINSGGGYIIFGSSNLPPVIDMANPPDQHVTVIYGAEGDRVSWRSGAILAGDLNNDGYQDFVTGSHVEHALRGRAYIIFGRPSNWPAVINLAQLQQGVCRITGPEGANNMGRLTEDNAMVSGDFTGDGINDLALGAGYGSGPGGLSRSECGRVYLFKGRRSWPTEINLAGGGSADMIVYGSYYRQGIAGRRANLSLQDLDLDGLDDLIIAHDRLYLGAPPGTVYVIYGTNNPPPSVDLSLGEQDVAINGVDVNDFLMFNGEAPLTDMNHDGKMDLVLSAPFGDGLNNARFNSGEAYIIFGNGKRLPPTVNLAAPPLDLLISYIQAEPAASLWHVATGDLNNDEIADVVFRTDTDGVDSNSKSGSVRVILGQAQWPPVIDLLAMPADLMVSGDATNEEFPDTVTIADVNEDNANDLILGCPYGNGPNNSRQIAGEAYIFLGISGNAPVSIINDWQLY